MTTKTCIFMAEDDSPFLSNQVMTVEDKDGSLEFSQLEAARTPFEACQDAWQWREMKPSFHA